MKRFVSGTVALVATGWMASAQAADIPYGSRSPYTVNQPLNIYSWAGPYLGANLGYAWGSVDHNPTKPSGFVGGAQVGYNWQTGAWVFGVEGDIQATGADDTFAPWKFSNPWFGTVRGRAGYALSNILLFGTGVWHSASCAVRHSDCRNPTPARAGPPASARNSASRRAGAPRWNISTSISPTATSPLPACRTVTGSEWCAPASTITSDSNKKKFYRDLPAAFHGRDFFT